MLTLRVRICRNPTTLTMGVHESKEPSGSLNKTLHMQSHQIITIAVPPLHPIIRAPSAWNGYQNRIDLLPAWI